MVNNQSSILGWFFVVYIITGLFFGFEKVSLFILSIAIIFLIVIGLYTFGESDNVKETLRVKQQQKNTRKQLYDENYEKVKFSVIARAQDAGLFASNESGLIRDVMVDTITTKHGLALRRDFRKFLAEDDYGRVSSAQIEDWKWHLLYIFDTCKLESQASKLRDLFKELTLLNMNSPYLSFCENLQSVNLKAITDFEIAGFLSSCRKSKKNYASDKLKHYRDSVYALFADYFNEDEKLRFNRAMTGLEYESFCADLLRRLDWQVVELPATGDHGADLLASNNKITVAIQCKKYSKPVGNTAVQEVATAVKHYEANYGVVVSNSSYTKGANTLARSAKVTLMHHDDLNDLINFLD